MSKPRRVWFASDLLCGSNDLDRPQNFENQFFEACENLILKDDILCILGNIVPQSVYVQDTSVLLKENKAGEWCKRIKGLSGEKILLLGNYDKYRIQWYYRFGFKTVVPFGDSLIIRSPYGNALISHLPAFESVLSSYNNTKFLGLSRKLNRIFDRNSCILNIHGHTLGHANENHRTIDVSLEAINCTPILFDQLLEVKFK